MNWSLATALAIFLSLELLIFLSQTAVTNIGIAAGEDATTFYNYDESHIKGFDTGDFVLTDDVSTALPTGQGQIEPESGNFFTDTWSTLKGWLLEKTGAKYVLDLVNAVPNFFRNMGLPTEIAFALGYFWHAMTIFLIIIFARGGNA